MSEERQGRMRGVILGCAAGDAMGLPYEGLSAAQGARVYGPPGVRHRLLWGCGMISDDTEHTLLVAQTLLAHPDDLEAFGRGLAWRLRGWFLAGPAGLGMATLRACARLCLGFGYASSGVDSAGNGPAMRAAVLGARFAEEPERMLEHLTIATRITHTHPQALTGARAVAELAAWAVRAPLSPGDPPARRAFEATLRGCGPDDAAWQDLVRAITAGLDRDDTVEAFAASLGLARGVTAYIYHTVPVVIFAWYRHFGDWRATVEAVMRCGGDVDTTAAIAGALAGAVTCERGIPRDWLDGLCERPRTLHHMRLVADALARPGSRPVPWSWPLQPLRNLLFFVLVLAHGLWRMLPRPRRDAPS